MLPRLRDVRSGPRGRRLSGRLTDTVAECFEFSIQQPTARVLRRGHSGDDVIQRLLNRYEELTHDEIRRSTDRWDLSVYPKVRVADVIPLDRLDIGPELYRFGLQAHFDFIVCRDKWSPEYAVEFDGPRHVDPLQAARDKKKDRLCEVSDFPILRINARYLTKDFGSMTLLAWILDVYELQRGFYEGQREGVVPADELFSPHFFMSIDASQERFPYWLSARYRLRLKKLCDGGLIRDPVTSGITGRDEDGVLRGIEFVRVDDKSGIYVKSAMRDQQFPVYMGDLFEEILGVQLVERVTAYVEGKVSAVPLQEIDAMIESMEERCGPCSGHSYGGALRINPKETRK